MSILIPASNTLADHLDLVDAALTTLSRRLPLTVSREDLATVGKLALIEALNHVEGAREEVRAYCFVRVRGAILDELRRLDPLSRRCRAQVLLVGRIQSELSARLGRSATLAELALATKLSPREVAAAQTNLSREPNVRDGELESLPDPQAPSPAESVEVEDLRFAMRTALARLSSTQAEVLYRYYFEEATLDTIAASLGVSKERVRQIREAGEKKLRADFVVLAIWHSVFDRA